jgi:hypothetical protein
MQHSNGSAAVPTTLAETIMCKIFFGVSLQLLWVRLATYLHCIPTMAALKLRNGGIGNVTCQKWQKIAAYAVLCDYLKFHLRVKVFNN